MSGAPVTRLVMPAAGSVSGDFSVWTRTARRVARVQRSRWGI